MEKHINKQSVKGKVIYLLILVAANQFIYPITDQGGFFLLIYQVLYASMFAAGIYLVSETRRYVMVTSATAGIFLIFGIWDAFNPTRSWIILATYIALIPFLATVLYVLVKYTFLSNEVTKDTLYAAVCMYLLIGAIFVPIYGILELLRPGSFIDNAYSDSPVVWQQLVYFSYVTLTTLGFGDVQPVSWWARSLVNVESVIGVLYIAIIIARMVGLYANKKHEA